MYILEETKRLEVGKKYEQKTTEVTYFITEYEKDGLVVYDVYTSKTRSWGKADLIGRLPLINENTLDYVTEFVKNRNTGMDEVESLKVYKAHYDNTGYTDNYVKEII